MHMRTIKFSTGGARLEENAGLADIPVIDVVLKFDEFPVGQVPKSGCSGRLHSLWHDPINPPAVREIDLIPADVSVVPIEDVHAAFGANFYAKSDPSQVVGGQKVVPVGTDETASIGLQYIGKDCVLVDVAHEKPVSIFLRECVRQVDPCSTVSGQVLVISDGLDVVVDMRVQMGEALFVVDAALDDMKEVGNHAHGCESLPMIVKIESPGIGESAGVHLELMRRGMETPDASIYELTLGIVLIRSSDS